MAEAAGEGRKTQSTVRANRPSLLFILIPSARRCRRQEIKAGDNANIEGTGNDRRQEAATAWGGGAQTGTQAHGKTKVNMHRKKGAGPPPSQSLPARPPEEKKGAGSGTTDETKG